MSKITIRMTATQLRGLLASVPDNATKIIKPERVEVHAIRKSTGIAELVISADKVGCEWDVTAPEQLIIKR
jgi:hypothetical protein